MSRRLQETGVSNSLIGELIFLGHIGILEMLNEAFTDESPILAAVVAPKVLDSDCSYGLPFSLKVSFLSVYDR